MLKLIAKWQHLQWDSAYSEMIKQLLVVALYAVLCCTLCFSTACLKRYIAQILKSCCSLPCQRLHLYCSRLVVQSGTESTLHTLAWLHFLLCDLRLMCFWSANCIITFIFRLFCLKLPSVCSNMTRTAHSRFKSSCTDHADDSHATNCI